MDRHNSVIEEIRKLDWELIAELQQKEEAFFYKVKGVRYSLMLKRESVTGLWLRISSAICGMPGF